MNLSAWLDARDPAAPAPLADRVAEALGHVADAREETSPRLFAAAELLLARLLSDGCATRDAAHDLLTADALVTYAFEAAAETDPATLGESAANAMRRIAALGQDGIS
jgi:hypothetical protein